MQRCSDPFLYVPYTSLGFWHVTVSGRTREDDWEYVISEAFEFGVGMEVANGKPSSFDAPFESIVTIQQLAFVP